MVPAPGTARSSEWSGVSCSYLGTQPKPGLGYKQTQWIHWEWERAKPLTQTEEWKAPHRDSRGEGMCLFLSPSEFALLTTRLEAKKDVNGGRS